MTFDYLDFRSRSARRGPPPPPVVRADLVRPREGKPAVPVPKQKPKVKMPPKVFRNEAGRAVIQAATLCSGWPYRALVGPSRDANLMLWRRAAIWLLKEYMPDISTLQLGRIFRRDHSTIIRALNEAKRRPEAIADQVAAMKETIE